MSLYLVAHKTLKALLLFHFLVVLLVIGFAFYQNYLLGIKYPAPLAVLMMLCEAVLILFHSVKAINVATKLGNL